MSPIRRNPIVLVGALPIVLGVGFLGLGHNAPAPLHARADVARAESHQAVADASPVIVSATFTIGAGGVAMNEAVIVLTTFVHHMIVGSDAATVSPQPQMLAC